ncbi:MAG: class I SAM-dependent methyltransferase [Planctomycetota bacterium]
MTTSDVPESTFERSCLHWSEQGREEMDAFYKLATVDYRLLAEQIGWGRLLAGLEAVGGGSLRLLDVACGSGQFPSALLQHGGIDGSGLGRVEYSLLDPSTYSIELARQKLTGPFEPAEEYPCTAQDFPATEESYDVVWATHALYCVPAAEVSVAVGKMVEALDAGGIGFIAHAESDSHYLRFQELYLQTETGRGREPYCNADTVCGAVEALAPQKAVHWSIGYEGVVPIEDKETAERYLQRCLFDDSLSLEAMMECDRLGPYLRGCQDEAAGLWRFPQRVRLVFFGERAAGIEDYRLSR